MYLAEEFLKSTSKPAFEGVIAYGSRAEHCWNGDPTRPISESRLRYHQMFIPARGRAHAQERAARRGPGKLEVLMTAMQVAILLLRLAAVAWALIVIHNAYDVSVQSLRDDPYSSFHVAGLWFYFALHLGVCALLWFFPAMVARKLVPSLPETSVAPAGTPAQWYSVGIILVGLLALTRGVTDLVYYVGLFAFSSAYEVPVADWDIENKAGVVATIAELGIGLWLILGAKGIVEMLFSFRKLGVRERDPGDQAGGS